MKSFVHSSWLYASLAAVGMVALLGACKSGPPTPKYEALDILIEAEGQALPMGIPFYVGPANEKHDRFLLGADVGAIIANLVNGQRREVKSYLTNLTVHTPKVMITKRDACWSGWLVQKQADHVVVLVDLAKNLEGERRAIIPLDRNGWKHLKGQPVHVRITDKGVELVDVWGYNH